MPIYHVSKPIPSRCQQVLATCVLSKGLLAKMLYTTYITSRLLCLFSLHSIKCANYVCYGIYYDGNFLADDFNRLTVKQKKLKGARDVILKHLLQEIDQIA
jgi:hypothetical protein